MAHEQFVLFWNSVMLFERVTVNIHGWFLHVNKQCPVQKSISKTAEASNNVSP